MGPFAKLVLTSAFFILHSPAFAGQVDRYLGVTEDQLSNQGYKKPSVANGVATWTKNKDGENVKIVSDPGKNLAITFKGKNITYAKYFDLDSEGYAISKTRCDLESKTSKYTCTTQTGEYCKKLIAAVKAEGFGVERLKTCGNILQKIDGSMAPLYKIQSENVAKMGPKLDLDTTEFVTLERPARRSVESILEDYGQCQTMEDLILGSKWAAPSKAPATAAPATRPIDAVN
jgi:hypothetical protein